jgi:hypothetical protein
MFPLSPEKKFKLKALAVNFFNPAMQSREALVIVGIFVVQTAKINYNPNV